MDTPKTTKYRPLCVTIINIPPPLRHYEQKYPDSVAQTQKNVDQRAWPTSETHNSHHDSAKWRLTKREREITNKLIKHMSCWASAHWIIVHIHVYRIVVVCSSSYWQVDSIRKIRLVPRTSDVNPPSRTKVDICLPNWRYVWVCLFVCFHIGRHAPCIVLLWALCRLPLGLWINGSAVVDGFRLRLLCSMCSMCGFRVCASSRLYGTCVEQNHFNPHINTRIYAVRECMDFQIQEHGQETVICVGMFPATRYTNIL